MRLNFRSPITFRVPWTASSRLQTVARPSRAHAAGAATRLGSLLKRPGEKLPGNKPVAGARRPDKAVWPDVRLRDMPVGGRFLVGGEGYELVEAGLPNGRVRVKRLTDGCYFDSVDYLTVRSSPS